MKGFGKSVRSWFNGVVCVCVGGGGGVMKVQIGKSIKSHLSNLVYICSLSSVLMFHFLSQSWHSLTFGAG